MNMSKTPFASASLLSEERRLLPTSCLVLAVALASCGGGGGSSVAVDPSPEVVTTQPELSRVEFGRLVDVYGYQTADGVTSIVPFRRDVIIGANIQDERGTNEVKRDDEILYDFIGSDPDSLQPKLLIPRETTSSDFRLALEALDDQLRSIAPMRAGTATSTNPFGVIPRNAAVRLSFTAPLGVDDSFFVVRSPEGLVTGLRNTEAVQLLQIIGDPDVPGGLVPMSVRVIVNERSLVLDPVLLGSEGLQYQTRNNAPGLPESPDSVGANMRIAVALDGPLAIPRLRANEDTELVGLNNSQRRSIIRDFRSGNSTDTSADLAQGFVRDPLPLRIVGEIVMYLERVDSVNALTQEITLYKNGASHEIDRGDVIRVLDQATGQLLGSGEVVTDPEDDRGQPGVQHVRVRVSRIRDLELKDPRNDPGYPANVTQREPWLVRFAPKAVCVAEFNAGGQADPVTGLVVGDDPRFFLGFTPTPLPNLDGTASQPNENVSPFAGAVVRFTKPVDMSSIKWADTFFFAMRDLANSEAITQFVQSVPNNASGSGIEPASFDLAKYRTPFLIASRVFDADGSQTAIRLQPSTGFYLDDTMRNPPAGADYRYYLHLIASSSDGGVRDLAGNPVDFQGQTPDRRNSVVIPFTVDTRMNGNRPYFDDNLAVSVVRRFASRDEDAQPSYFIPSEVPAPGTPPTARTYPLEDLAGAFIYLDGKLQSRPTARVRQIADNLNQSPVGAAGSILKWCPNSVSGENQRASNSSTAVFPQGIQNPLNPNGCRLQTLWREVDLSLSRSDPFDFNLDIEQMYWAPYTGTNLIYDEFDRVSLFLGHSEYRPSPCIGDFSSMPSLPDSGLRAQFAKNFVWNPQPTGSGTAIQSQPSPFPAYVDRSLAIDPSTVVYEPNQVNRFLPLPEFSKPYFVFRDETVKEQGCNSATGTDMGGQGAAYEPYILSPFPNGFGRRWIDTTTAQQQPVVQFVPAFWNDAVNNNLATPATIDSFTGGLVGSIALPLLADFWTYCDTPDLPLGNGYVALGTNGWQIALTAQSSPQPNFRVLSAGRAALQSGQPALCMSPGSSQWNSASGGFTPGGQPTANADNSFYWMMIDVLKRQSVVTSGFVDLNNPHRVPEGFTDSRLGPFYLASGNSTRPANVVPSFTYEFDPPLGSLPAGTSVVPQFRAAGAVDGTPWYWDRWVRTSGPLTPTPPWTTTPDGGQVGFLKPDANNFPLDPFKAGDAHIRKWDTRTIPGTGASRNWWTYFYNRTVTDYVEDPNRLMEPSFVVRFQGPNEAFTQRDIRYVNWRFVMSNKTDPEPAVSPVIETFSLSYRFQRNQ